LKVIELKATPIPLDMVILFFANHPFGRGLFNIYSRLTMGWPTLLGYQWVAKACKAA
jgi:hypothetical protein